MDVTCHQLTESFVDHSLRSQPEVTPVDRTNWRTRDRPPGWRMRHCKGRCETRCTIRNEFGCHKVIRSSGESERNRSPMVPALLVRSYSQIYQLEALNRLLLLQDQIR